MALSLGGSCIYTAVS